MAAEQARAAERTAAAGAVVMAGGVLGLRRADGGCGWRQGLRWAFSLRRAESLQRARRSGGAVPARRDGFSLPPYETCDLILEPLNWNAWAAVPPVPSQLRAGASCCHALSCCSGQRCNVQAQPGTHKHNKQRHPRRTGCSSSPSASSFSGGPQEGLLRRGGRDGGHRSARERGFVQKPCRQTLRPPPPTGASCASSRSAM